MRPNWRITSTSYWDKCQSCSTRGLGSVVFICAAVKAHNYGGLIMPVAVMMHRCAKCSALRAANNGYYQVSSSTVIEELS